MLPILYQSHELILYSYPLFMGLGWGVAYQLYFSLVPSASSRIRAQLLFWGLFLSSWIGSKVLFVVTYPGKTDFADELSFWTGGGFVFYGGLLAGFLYLLAYRLTTKSLSLGDTWPMVPALAIGHGIGRLGCLLAGCCYGKPTQLIWGIFMHQDYRHPTQLIEATGLLILGIYLYRSRLPRITLMARYLLFYGLLRLGVEPLRGDGIRGAWGPLSPSQWISIALVGSAFLFMRYNKFKPLGPARSK